MTLPDVGVVDIGVDGAYFLDALPTEMITLIGWVLAITVLLVIGGVAIRTLKNIGGDGSSAIWKAIDALRAGQERNTRSISELIGYQKGKENK